MAASADVRWGNTRVAITDDDVTDKNNSSSDTADVDFIIMGGFWLIPEMM
jgi:hypothetical protein